MKAEDERPRAMKMERRETACTFQLRIIKPCHVIFHEIYTFSLNIHDTFA